MEFQFDMTNFTGYGTTLRRNLKGVEALEAYVGRTGTALVPVAYRDENGYRLGQWVTYIRNRHNMNPATIALDLKMRLEALPNWSWGPLAPGPSGKPDRNQAILERRREGVALSLIAQEFGISRQRVHQIIQRDLTASK